MTRAESTAVSVLFSAMASEVHPGVNRASRCWEKYGSSGNADSDAPRTLAADAVTRRSRHASATARASRIQPRHACTGPSARMTALTDGSRGPGDPDTAPSSARSAQQMAAAALGRPSRVSRTAAAAAKTVLATAAVETCCAACSKAAAVATAGGRHCHADATDAAARSSGAAPTAALTLTSVAAQSQPRWSDRGTTSKSQRAVVCGGAPARRGWDA
mmetsp:Transcript_31321/g.108275  ORF Transcript_31321/g.108275 Transcript_31321/m.108275 type:complete len:217 (-) Transcript_31321:1-651(-)